MSFKSSLNRVFHFIPQGSKNGLQSTSQDTKSHEPSVRQVRERGSLHQSATSESLAKQSVDHSLTLHLHTDRPLHRLLKDQQDALHTKGTLWRTAPAPPQPLLNDETIPSLLSNQRFEKTQDQTQSNEQQKWKPQMQSAEDTRPKMKRKVLPERNDDLVIYKQSNEQETSRAMLCIGICLQLRRRLRVPHQKVK